MSSKKIGFKNHIFCCVNERSENNPKGCCGSKGAATLRNYMKLRAKELGIESIRVNNSGCLDFCDKGPVMVIYPEGVWYKYSCKEDIDRILFEHVVSGNEVADLLL